ncbi:MAG: IS630 family transposase [Verrucomicrobiales bacterium]
MGRVATAIELSEFEKKKLELIAARPKSLQRDAIRARIVLACAEGKQNKDVAEEMGVSNQTVGKWRERFASDRLAGLVDAPRSGTPRTISDEKVEEVLTRTLKGPPENRTHWSRRQMARLTGIGQDSVGRIWRTFGVKPHVVNGFKLSKDPMFTEKVRDIVGLYLNPPARAIVLSVDEKSQCQALERAQPVLPMDLGRPECQTHDYIRHGTTSLFAALEVATGKVIGQCHKKHRHQEFIKFLEHLDNQYTYNEGETLHLIVDNYATHNTPQVLKWLSRHPRFEIHFTPTGASWLNQIERFFGLITSQRIRRGSFKSVAELERAISDYIEQHNGDPKPFAWTKTAEQIFDKITSSFN